MAKQVHDWPAWVRFFSARAARRLPQLEDPTCYADIPVSVTRSLAVFQLGESGGGTIVEQCRHSKVPFVDRHYADAIELFVREEHRHAEILAICIRNLGGKLLRRNWTAKLFVAARRLIGLRLKILVLLAAEVVGICFYQLLAARLPRSRLKSLLSQLVNDEMAHLHFHCEFLRLQMRGSVGQAVFRIAWRLTMLAAATVVLIDHRRALADLDLDTRSVWRRWSTCALLAEQLVTGNPARHSETFRLLEFDAPPLSATEMPAPMCTDQLQASA